MRATPAAVVGAGGDTVARRRTRDAGKGDVASPVGRPSLLRRVRPHAQPLPGLPGEQRALAIPCAIDGDVVEPDDAAVSARCARDRRKAGIFARPAVRPLELPRLVAPLSL